VWEPRLGGSTFGPWLSVRRRASESVSDHSFRKENVNGLSTACRDRFGDRVRARGAGARRGRQHDRERKAVTTIESLSVIESSALEGTPAETRLEVVIEPHQLRIAVAQHDAAAIARLLDEHLPDDVARWRSRFGVDYPGGFDQHGARVVR
jgi:hypothetical protein